MTKLTCNCSDRLDHLENEILKAESALSEIDAELLLEHPDYETLMTLAKEVIARAKRIRKAIKRDKKYFS